MPILTLRQNMFLFKPAIAIMNRLKYPQKFFLISLLFVLPLALVMNLLLSELDSRIEFTQKEIYGNAYLRPISQLWQYIPQRQLILQNQFYKSLRSINLTAQSEVLQLQTRELDDLQSLIDNEFVSLSNVDKQLGVTIQTGERLKDLQLSWQDLRDMTGFIGFRNHDLLLEKLAQFRVHVVDSSNLILDPDLDTYYLMDASAVKLPEMQKILNKLMQTSTEILFDKEITNLKKESLISLLSLLEEYNNDLTSNLERAFRNNPRGNLRDSLSSSLRIFAANLSEVIANTNQIVGKDNKFSLADGFYRQASSFKYSFTLSQQIVDRLDELLIYRIQGFAQRKQFILIFVAVIFSAILYLFIGFYLSVMRTVHQLDVAAKQMTLGGAISINLDSKDELSMVVRSFNSVAIALRESEAKYRSIFENSVDGIFQTTVEGKYLSVNPALARIYG